MAAKVIRVSHAILFVVIVTMAILIEKGIF